jgi:signal transduction histidine kinase
MREQITYWLTSLDRLVDWFIPVELREREVRQRARMFLISHFFGPVLSLVIPVYLYFLDPKPGFTLGILAASISCFWIFPFLLKGTGRFTILALLSLQNLTFAILWGCYYYGGVSSPFLPWLLTIPLFAFFYLGPTQQARYFVLGLIAINLTGVYGLYFMGHSFPHRIPVRDLQGIGIVSILSASVYVSMMALYYAKILASQAELESIVKGHLATANELRRATTEAERAGAAKADFLAKMSHELRTPLNAVIGYSQILLEDAADEGDEETAVDLEKIHGAGHHLLRLVNEVLDLSKIEAGKMELVPEDVQLTPLLNDAVGNFKDAAAQKGTELSLHVEGELGVIVCDPMRVRQALVQLVDNAIKFTAAGRIDVSARRFGGPEREMLEIRVRDTGVGIATHNIPRLFEKFTVASDASASKYGGTGLGLALSKKLCGLMGGDITVESQLGVGSCFTMILPTFPPADPELASEDEGTAPGSSDAHFAASPHETARHVQAAA